jgi:hypothetical protein
MEKVVLDGREYTKASVVAKQFNYTSDYLGQLCRGKKIDARVIGRTWFVNVDSLQGHRSQKYASLKKPKEQNDSSKESALNSGIAPKQYIKRVSMPLRSVHKTLTTPVTGTLGAGAREVDVQYTPDEASLLPSIRKGSKTTLLKVSPAGAERLDVRSDGARTSILSPEPMPEVYLKGSLSVKDATDKEKDLNEISEKRDNEINKAEVEPTSETQHLNINQKTPRSLKVTIKRLDSKTEEVIKDPVPIGVPPSLSKSTEKYTYSVTIKKPIAVPNEIVVNDLENAPQSGSSLPITVMVCSAVVMSVVLLSVANIITVTTSGYDSSFEFQASLLLAFFHL